MPQVTIDISNPEAKPLFEGVAVGDVLDIQVTIEGVAPNQIKAYVDSVEEVETEEVPVEPLEEPEESPAMRISRTPIV